jgi:hypothetical protein
MPKQKGPLKFESKHSSANATKNLIPFPLFLLSNAWGVKLIITVVQAWRWTVKDIRNIPEVLLSC